MLLLRCSLVADSMSRSTSFCPSTIATRSSSCCVALYNMRFTFCSPARVGERHYLVYVVLAPCGLGKSILFALLVVSLLPVSEINQRFRLGCGRAGGGLQGSAAV